jgi:hypothetical protein
MGRWNRYWFATGGRTALAIVRIAVAASVLLALARLADAESPVAAQVYRPVGIWMLLGHTAPPAALVTALWLVAWVSTGTMLVGLATRASTAVSFVSAVALAALSFSASHTWSHQYNVVFLAQLALLGARGGDTVSLDWLIRTRVRRLPALDLPQAYQWSLRLVQLAVVLMFAGAAVHKLAHGHFTLRWALSDNLRHHLLVRFDLAGLDRPPVVDWILAESWRYRGAAVLNILAQAAPLLAVIFVRRPVVRIAAGMMFVVETLMLGVVVDLWNLHWLPLVAVFIDWEWLLARFRPSSKPVDLAGFRPPRITRAFILAFVLYDLVTAFIPTLDQRLNTFPFSSFPMFATIRAREPYSEHLPYSLVAGTYELISDHPADARAQRWLDHQHRTVHTVRKPDELHRRLATVLERMRYYYDGYGIHGLRLWVTVHEAPAYPGPAELRKHPMAVLGEIAADGTFRTLLGTLALGGAQPHIEVAPRGIALPPDATLHYFRDERPELIPIAAPLVGTRFDLRGIALPGNPRHFVVEAAGMRWLVGSHETWRWK